MGLFSGMEKFGLGNYENANIIEKPAVPETKKHAKAVDTEKREEDYLFDKHYTCPVCDAIFVSKNIRASKAKLAGKDTDLRPIYEVVDTQKYDAITCDKCGYSAINRYFPKVSGKQGKAIKEAVSQTFTGISNDLPTYSYDDAIVRYKLALICCVVKGAKNSERAYTSLKLAWTLRGKRESLDENDEEVKELYADEMECLKNAYDGFEIALSKEPLPIAGIDEISLKYIMADIARKMKMYNTALRYVADILMSKSASQRIKDEALKQKELIRHEMKEGGEIVDA